MTTWRARLGVVAIFVVGFLCGAVTLQLVRARQISHALSHREAWPERVAQHLTRRLDLTKEQQRATFEKISARRRAKFLERFGPPGGAPAAPAPTSQPR